MHNIVIYLPSENGFYGGIDGKNNLVITDYLNCMHFNSVICSDWYEALLSLCKNDKKFSVMNVLNENI